MVTKLFRKTKEIGDKKKIQDDIAKLVKWSEKWQKLFNFGKCKCLHTGPGNTGMNYEMGGTILSKTVKEIDLGVTMNGNIKVSEQCRIAASNGNQVLGMIRRNITYKENSLIVPLYKAIVRPHLEYCIQARSPHLRKDIDAYLDASKAFDRVNHQKLFAKLIEGGAPRWCIRILCHWYCNQLLCVRWESVVSDFSPVNNGVRQGGIMSPLFLIFM